MFNINQIINRLDKFAHDVLGDTVTVELGDGTKCDILAMFEWRNEPDEMIDRVDDSFPILEEIKEKDKYLFKKWEDVTIHYKGAKYSILHYTNKNDRNATAILRTHRIRP